MLKIKRIDHNGKESEALIDLEKLTQATEHKEEKKPVYDVNTGELVEYKDAESTYILFFSDGGKKIKVSKETYDKLVAKLNVEEL
jgi:hypothetical protein